MQSRRSRWRGWVYPGLGLLIAGLGVVQQLAAPAAPNLPAALCACVLAGAAVAVLPVAPHTRSADLTRAASLAVMLLLDCGYQLVAGDPPFATFVATTVAMFHLARSGTRRMMLIWYPATLLTLVAMDIVVSARGQDSPANVIIPIVYFGAASGLGALVRHTANYARISRERAEALEREQGHLADLAAAAERTRIARELHDVISHTVSLMVLQAEAAREVLDTQPARTAAVLEAIGDTGRRAIGDLRVLLGVLREQDAGGSGSFDLAALVDQVRRSGVRVDFVETGGPVPGSLRATAYRVVQESLTNVLKHAAAASVVITVAHGTDGLTLEIVDDGAANPVASAVPAGSGRGLAGMAERVQAQGGTLETTHLDPQGFRVLARLPGAAA